MRTGLLASLIGLLSLLGLIPPAQEQATPPAGGEGTAAPASTPARLERPDSASIDRDAADEELPTAGPIDVERYAGLWYELARLPVRFQDPASVSTAKYGVLEDGTISVENTSIIGEEVGYRIRGTAEPVDPDRRDRLRVRFGGFLSAIPVPDEGNYWIIELEPDYSLALVGTPDRDFLWLLARDGEQPDVARAQAMLDRAATLGFDTDELAIADWSQRVMREP